MARTRKAKLSPVRARLQWVFDNWAERSPLVPLYTLYVVHEIGSPGYYRINAPLPWGDMVQEIRQFARSRAFFDVPGRPTVEPWEFVEGWEPGSLHVLTVENMIGWLLAWQRFIGLHGESTQGRDCAKVIPHIARWVQHEIDQRPRVMAHLDRIWYSPVISQGPLHVIGSDDYTKADGEAMLDFVQAVWTMASGIRDVCDFYSAEKPELGSFESFAAVKAAADRWHEQIAITKGGRFEKGPVVYEWEDGWTVQELTNFEMFKEEGGALGHCLALTRDYYDDFRREVSRFFSLRTPRNEPWLTFEVDGRIMRPGDRSPGAIVNQIQGCKTRRAGMTAGSRDCPPPDPNECTRVWDFLAATEWNVGPDYRSCWVLTVRLLGYGIEKADPSNFLASALVRPPSPLPRGKATKRLHPSWPNEPS